MSAFCIGKIFAEDFLESIRLQCEIGDDVEFKIADLRKNYEKKEVLKGIDFTFESGKIYALLGRNGSGKTTLFNCINNDIDFESGEFSIIDAGQERKLEAQDIGYVLSAPTVPEFLTGREFLKFFMDINHIEGTEKEKFEGLFDMVKIKPEDRGNLMKDYSHGMKNKMQMLVNFVANPRLLLLDEPLTSLDVVVAEEMKGILRQMKGDRVTILSTHILDLALDLCDEIVLMHNGKLEKLAIDVENDKEARSRIIEALSEEDA